MSGASTAGAKDYPAATDELPGVNSRIVEAAFLVAIMLAILVGGRSWILDVAQFHGIAVGVLGIIAVFVVYAFRRSFLAGGPLARLHATRDAAFLAALAAAIAFVLSPARWSLGATIAAAEFALIVELLSRFAPAPP
jgi:hypothetical protein